MASNTPAALELATRLHRAGDLARAEIEYRRTLENDANNWQALNGLGACLAQRGDVNAAIGVLERAVRCAAGDSSAAYSQANLGAALQEAGRFEEALRVTDQALASLPGNADLLVNRGNVLHGLARDGEAVRSYALALERSPGNTRARLALSVALDASGHSIEALQELDTAVRIAPRNASVHYNRGVVLCKLKRYEDSQSTFERAIQIEPDHADAHFHLGLVFKAMSKWEMALSAFERVMALRADYPDLQPMRASVLAALGRFEDALAICELALAARPEDLAIRLARADVLRHLRRYTEAAQGYEDAIARSAGIAQIGEARLYAAYCHLFLGNRSACLAHLNEYSRALTDASSGVEAATAHMNVSACYLLLGELRAGWKHFEWRWRNAQIQLPHPWPPERLWLGDEDPSGMTIFVHAEQGLGDTIQFCRYLPELARRGARVKFLAAHTLRPVLQSLEGPDVTLIDAEEEPDFDRHVPLLSLPLAFGTELGTIPDSVPYLSVPEARVRHWGARLGSTTWCRIGLAWSGRSGHVNDARRSMPLRALTDLLQGAHGAQLEWIAVQKEIRSSDLADVNRLGLRRVDAELKDMADTAALIEHLDLTISVDTSVAHLAGALGRPVWVLLPYVPDWRWMLGRSDSPWYPSARLFRQPAPDDWQSLVRELAAALGAWLAARSAH